jgi:hypothetical protein
MNSGAARLRVTREHRRLLQSQSQIVNGGMATNSKRRPAKKKNGVAKELGAIHQWMKDHERHDDERFEEGRAKMNTLATKDDTSEIMNLLLDDSGQPKFATKSDMQPMIDLYKGGTLAKSLLTGAAVTLITISALGYAIISIIGWIRGN